MIYSYTAITAKGVQTSGYIKAKSNSDARRTLSSFSLKIRNVSVSIGYTILAFFLKSYEGVQEKHLLDFSETFRDLISSGESLTEVLRISRNSMPNKVTRSAMDRVRILVESQGISIADAMLKSGFPKFYTSQLAVGFDSGAVDVTLDRLIAFYRWKDKSAWELKKLLIYPAFLMAFVVAFILGVIYYIMPQLADLFEGKPDLPLITRIMYSIGNGELRHNPAKFTLLIVFTIFTSVVLWKILKYLFTLMFIKAKPETIVGRNPLVRFYHITVLSTYIAALSTSMAEGFSLTVSLQRAAELFVHPEGYFRKVADEAIKKIQQGRSLLVSLEPFFFDEVLAVHLKVGEKSGNVVQALDRISDKLRQRAEKYVEPAANVVKFASIIIVGIVVATAIFSIYFPMYKQMINAFD